MISTYLYLGVRSRTLGQTPDLSRCPVLSFDRVAPSEAASAVPRALRPNFASDIADPGGRRLEAEVK